MHRIFAITSYPRAVVRLDTHLVPALSPQSAGLLGQAPTALVTERNALPSAGRLHATTGLTAQDGGSR
jgi:hypothetical protein